MRNQQEKFNQQYQHNTRKEGEVRLKNNKSKKEKDDSDFGEYVDYEDVDEK